MVLKSIRFTVLFTLLILINLCHSTILITSPAINPFNQSKIPYSYTNIGNIPYGKTLVFDLKQLGTTIDLCSNIKKNNTTTNSSQNSTDNIDNIITLQLIKDPTYLLVDPSSSRCTYVTQAINAQELGAKGLIFVSDMVDYFGKMILIDDGNGRKVHISVLMINHANYQLLKTIKSIQIKVLFEVFKTDKVNLTYYLSASGRTNYIFLRQFTPYYQLIADYINFKPLYLTIPCIGCADKDCLISKEYCMFDLDTYKDSVGQYILTEQLKQWSIWKNYGTRKYLSYMNDFDKLCTANWMDSQQCGDRILRTMELFKPKLDDGPTNIMNIWRKQEIAAGFVTTPQITINSQLYAGTENSTQLFMTICSFLNNPPSACTGQNSAPVNKGRKVGWIIGSIIIACILSIGFGFLIYKRCVKKELTKDMFSKVNELVAKYATKVSEHNKKRKEKLTMKLTQQL